MRVAFGILRQIYTMFDLLQLHIYFNQPQSMNVFV